LSLNFSKNSKSFNLLIQNLLFLYNQEEEEEEGDEDDFYLIITNE
jgi:hypothetical protein